MRTPQSPTTLENPSSRRALEELRLPVRAKLAAAWTSLMFLYVYVDILNFFKPGVIDDILAGIVHEFDTGPTFVALALTLMTIPSLMVLLSATLPARLNRIVNLVVAALFIPVTIYNVAGEESWAYAYFYGQNRVPLSLDRVSPHAVDALQRGHLRPPRSARRCAQ